MKLNSKQLHCIKNLINIQVKQYNGKTYLFHRIIPYMFLCTVIDFAIVNIATV